MKDKLSKAQLHLQMALEQLSYAKAQLNNIHYDVLVANVNTNLSDACTITAKQINALQVIMDKSEIS